MGKKWITLESWQKKKISHWFLFFTVTSLVFISVVCIHMNREKSSVFLEYSKTLENESYSEELKEKVSTNAVPVRVGTYVENIKAISLKECNFRTTFLVWFRWDGDAELDFQGDAFRIYNGLIHKKELLKDYHRDGVHYQQFRMDVTVSKSFNIARFPLGSQILKFYIEPNTYMADEVVIVPDKENSGVNQNLNISGYSLVRNDIAEHIIVYPNDMNQPDLTVPRVSSELVTILEINRSDWGLYMKCFIALFGTTVWVFIVLYVCANHKVNPLGTIPSALFGTVGNLMVGANLLPDMVQVGLVEYVNIFGIMIVLFGALSIININRIREYKANTDFAKLYGRVMFYTLLIICLFGQIVIPLSAHIWGM